jgi:chromate reductase
VIQVNTFTVGHFVGGLVKASLNRLLSKGLIRLAPAACSAIATPRK